MGYTPSDIHVSARIHIRISSLSPPHRVPLLLREVALERDPWLEQGRRADGEVAGQDRHDDKLTQLTATGGWGNRGVHGCTDGIAEWTGGRACRWRVVTGDYRQYSVLAGGKHTNEVKDIRYLLAGLRRVAAEPGLISLVAW